MAKPNGEAPEWAPFRDGAEYADGLSNEATGTIDEEYGGATCLLKESCGKPRWMG